MDTKIKENIVKLNKKLQTIANLKIKKKKDLVRQIEKLDDYREDLLNLMLGIYEESEKQKGGRIRKTKKRKTKKRTKRKTMKGGGKDNDKRAKKKDKGKKTFDKYGKNTPKGMRVKQDKMEKQQEKRKSKGKKSKK